VKDATIVALCRGPVQEITALYIPSFVPFVIDSRPRLRATLKMSKYRPSGGPSYLFNQFKGGARVIVGRKAAYHIRNNPSTEE
jgi:hypothetical protein